jgi:hypothetical protein
VSVNGIGRFLKLGAGGSMSVFEFAYRTGKPRPKHRVAVATSSPGRLQLFNPPPEFERDVLIPDSEIGLPQKNSTWIPQLKPDKEFINHG